MTILITGGTGRVGSAAIQSLLDSGEAVRCLSRSPEKLEALPDAVERCLADLDDPTSLPRAFEGVHATLLSLAVHPEEGKRGLAAIEAATEANVRKIVQISVKHYPGAESRVFYQAKQAIEARLAQGPFVSTVLRSANFFQSDSMLKPYIVDAGIYPPPIGSIGVDRIDSRDVGHAAAMALTTAEFEGQDVELYGPKTYTGETVAETYATVLGRAVKYMGDDIGAWAELNAPRLGAWYIEALRGLYEQQQRFGMLRPEGADQHPLLPGALRTFEAYADEMVSEWTRQ